MTKRPILVLADDLTGAAEIAGIAHAAGLSAVVLTTPADEPLAADVIVLDTDTRLAPPAVAAEKVRSDLERLTRHPHGAAFKKTDSVLRGNVLAETEAMRTTLGLIRTVLVPANPSIGRTIIDGVYSISGQPLHHTPFARDPHHPRHSANVMELLAAEGDSTPLSCRKATDPLPDKGLIVGDACIPADMQAWAERIDKTTLAAGGGDFFRAWLGETSSLQPEDPAIPAPTLLLSGTHTPTTAVTPLPGFVCPLEADNLPAPNALAANVVALLKADNAASIVMTGPLVANAGAPIARTFALIARHLRDAGAFRHLIIAGGATAAAVLTALDWTRLEVVHIWGPGVVTLRPISEPSFFVTLKPGSYAWPVSLSRHLQPPVTFSA